MYQRRSIKRDNRRRHCNESETTSNRVVDFETQEYELLSDLDIRFVDSEPVRRLRDESSTTRQIVDFEMDRRLRGGSSTSRWIDDYETQQRRRRKDRGIKKTNLTRNGTSPAIQRKWIFKDGRNWKRLRWKSSPTKIYWRDDYSECYFGTVFDISKPGEC